MPAKPKSALPLTRQRGEGRSRFWGKPLSILAPLGEGPTPASRTGGFQPAYLSIGALRQDRSEIGDIRRGERYRARRGSRRDGVSWRRAARRYRGRSASG